MNSDEIRTAVVDSLRAVAPEADLSTLAGDVDIREALDIDSMDFLSFVTSVNGKLKVDIPERDYRLVRTLDTCVQYISERLASPGTR